MTPNKQTVTDNEMEIIRKLYAGINRFDLDYVISLLHDDIMRIEPEGFPTAGIYRGHADMRKHLMTGRSTWAEGSCEPIGFMAAANKILVTVHIKVRLKDKTEWIDGRITDGFIIKDGRVAAFHSFSNEQKAFEWAGISDQ